jgi:hypothetical protein
MLLYPDPLGDYPASWVDEMSSFRDEESILRLEKRDTKGLIQNADLRGFYETIEELDNFPSLPELPPLPENSFTFLHTIPKKQHEIRKLAPFIHHFYHTHSALQILDIGGGIGLLAQTLVNQYDLNVTSLDMDSTLQETGSKRHKKNAHHKGNQVSFVNAKVTSQDVSFRNLLTPQSITVGLHTCGPLAVEQIQASYEKKIQGIINLGCCYYKLGQHGENQNLSKTAQTQLAGPLVFNHFALTLASRGHRKISKKDYDLKLKVKFYRYAMHFLLHDHYGLRSMVTLGNSHPHLYQQSFGTYALEQLRRLNLTPIHDPEELESFYQEPERQKLIHKMLTAGFIRNALGRPIELYLLLDRALYLKEHGYQTQLLSFFQEDLSPRNLGIIASRLP